MQRSCSNCQAPFEITDADLAFYEKVSPIFGGKRYDIPPPTFCPDCRQQRRLSLCNEFNLYPGTCGLCKKRTLTQFPPESGVPYYCRECWHSDKWDPLSFGHDVDLERPVFEQIALLKKMVPSLALDVQGNLENCDYIHFAGSSKNCYLIMHADFCEDCMYGYGFKYDKACIDGFYNLNSELCYDCIDVHKCYDLIHCQDCLNCNASAFLRDCIGCQSCFLCAGLRNKQYCFENVQLSKEEYHKRVDDLHMQSWSQYQLCTKRLRELELRHPFREYQGHNREQCSGNHLYNCKNVQASFDCENVETGAHLYQVVNGAKDVYDIYQYGLNLQQSLECTIAGEQSYHILFSYGCHNTSEALYCWYLEQCKDCFGCVNMRQKKYCIFNKQYSKEEYEELVSKIIAHMRDTPLRSDGASAGQAVEWGEHFPTTLSPFGYNKTTAQQYYPLAQEEALRRGWHWDGTEPPPPPMTKAIDAKLLPDAIEEIPDDILNWAIRCEVTGKLFKIQQMELMHYRLRNLPIPRRSPYQRHLDRLAKRNPRKFWKRNCASCKREIVTTWSLERPEIIYCEACYASNMY